MSTNLTEGTGFTATVPVLDDGDGITGAALVATAQPLADRTNYLKARVPDTSVIVPFHVYQDNATGTGWIFDSTNINWICTSAGTFLHTGLFLPNKGTLTALTAYVAGDSTGGTAYATAGLGLPTMPILRAYSRDMSAATAWTDEGGATDTAGTEAAFDAAHAVTVSGLSISLAENKQFMARITGPQGAAYIDDKFGLLGITAAITF